MGAGRSFAELMAINYGRQASIGCSIFRPHNVYGPDMGREHVLPQFALRLKRLCREHPQGVIPFPIQGTGQETRSFIHIDDFVTGLMLVLEKGQHLNIYHIGTEEERSIAEAAQCVADYFGRSIRIEPGAITAGSTPRRCPSIEKLKPLGFVPQRTFHDGVGDLVRWYDANASLAPSFLRLPYFPRKPPCHPPCLLPPAPGPAWSSRSASCATARISSRSCSSVIFPRSIRCARWAAGPRSSPPIRRNCWSVRIASWCNWAASSIPRCSFLPDYPYTSGTTRILHQNFAEMVEDCKAQVIDPGTDGLVVDIGSNDGTLLSKWKQAGHRVHGIEPTDKAQLADSGRHPQHAGLLHAGKCLGRGAAARSARQRSSRPPTFSRISRTSTISWRPSCCLLDEDGVFISESHYLMSLLETCQYDTIYHEHLRYYSVHSLQYLLARHGLDLVRVKKHPQPRRVGSRLCGAQRHAARAALGGGFLAEEEQYGVAASAALHAFAKRVVMSKLKLYGLLKEIKDAASGSTGLAPRRGPAR